MSTSFFPPLQAIPLEPDTLVFDDSAALDQEERTFDILNFEPGDYICPVIKGTRLNGPYTPLPGLEPIHDLSERSIATQTSTTYFIRTKAHFTRTGDMPLSPSIPKASLYGHDIEPMGSFLQEEQPTCVKVTEPIDITFHAATQPYEVSSKQWSQRELACFFQWTGKEMILVRPEAGHYVVFFPPATMPWIRQCGVPYVKMEFGGNVPHGYASLTRDPKWNGKVPRKRSSHRTKPF